MPPEQPIVDDPNLSDVQDDVNAARQRAINEAESVVQRANLVLDVVGKGQLTEERVKALDELQAHLHQLQNSIGTTEATGQRIEEALTRIRQKIAEQDKLKRQIAIDEAQQFITVPRRWSEFITQANRLLNRQIYLERDAAAHPEDATLAELDQQRQTALEHYRQNTPHTPTNWQPDETNAERVLESVAALEALNTAIEAYEEYRGIVEGIRTLDERSVLVPLDTPVTVEARTGNRQGSLIVLDAKANSYTSGTTELAIQKTPDGWRITAKPGFNGEILVNRGQSPEGWHRFPIGTNIKTPRVPESSSTPPPVREAPANTDAPPPSNQSSPPTDTTPPPSATPEVRSSTEVQQTGPRTLTFPAQGVTRMSYKTPTASSSEDHVFSPGTSAVDYYLYSAKQENGQWKLTVKDQQSADIALTLPSGQTVKMSLGPNATVPAATPKARQTPQPAAGEIPSDPPLTDAAEPPADTPKDAGFEPDGTRELTPEELVEFQFELEEGEVAKEYPDGSIQACSNATCRELRPAPRKDASGNIKPKAPEAPVVPEGITVLAAEREFRLPANEPFSLTYNPPHNDLTVDRFGTGGYSGTLNGLIVDARVDGNQRIVRVKPSYSGTITLRRTRDGATTALELKAGQASVRSAPQGTSEPRVESAPGTVTEIADMASFTREVINSPEPVLVDFYKIPCGACETMAPIMEKLAGQLRGRARVVKVNAELLTDIRNQYCPHTQQGNMWHFLYPSFVVFDNGRARNKHIGSTSESTLTQLLPQQRVARQ